MMETKVFVHIEENKFIGTRDEFVFRGDFDGPRFWIFFIAFIDVQLKR
jgi:hypothetical protein